MKKAEDFYSAELMEQATRMDCDFMGLGLVSESSVTTKLIAQIKQQAQALADITNNLADVKKELADLIKVAEIMK